MDAGAATAMQRVVTFTFTFMFTFMRVRLRPGTPEALLESPTIPRTSVDAKSHSNFFNVAIELEMRHGSGRR
jgi:hypothetical protein